MIWVVGGVLSDADCRRRRRQSGLGHAATLSAELQTRERISLKVPKATTANSTHLEIGRAHV